MKSIRTPLSRESGFTIVELMVGMLIGLVSIIVMFQVFAVSEGQRRTTGGAGDAQQNGVTSLYLMERDARMSGYGLNYYRLLGCTVNGYWAPSAQAFSFNLAPVTIANGAAGTAPDTMTFMYTDTHTFAFPSVPSLPGTIGTTGFVRIKDKRFTYKAGDLFVIGQVPLATESPILRPCSLFQVTGFGGVDNSTQIDFGGNTYVDNGVTRAANYTPPTARSSTQVPPNNVTYPQWSNANKAGARMLNLGPSPTVMRYSIVNNQLVSQNMLVPTEAATPIADGIVQLQAQYGISGANPATPLVGCQPAPVVIIPCYVSPTAPSQTVAGFLADNWADSLPTGAGAVQPQNWRQIIAMRFVIVARSGQREKVNPTTGICDTTTALPVWSVNSRTLDLTMDPDWKCYRYTKFETVVPIRNMLWFPDPNGFNSAAGSD